MYVYHKLIAWILLKNVNIALTKPDRVKRNTINKAIVFFQYLIYFVEVLRYIIPGKVIPMITIPVLPINEIIS